MFDNLRADFGRYIKDSLQSGKKTAVLYVFFEQGLWAICVYRFGRWIRAIKIPVISILFKFIAFLLFKMTEIVTGISLPASAKIGKGFYIGHFGGIILHSDAEIGENCSIGPGVVIGTRGVGNQGVPVIGDNVYIGVAAKILGGIRVGNNAKIGANAVVLENIPDGATVVGPLGQIVRKD